MSRPRDFSDLITNPAMEFIDDGDPRFADSPSGSTLARLVAEPDAGSVDSLQAELANTIARDEFWLHGAGAADTSVQEAPPEAPPLQPPTADTSAYSAAADAAGTADAAPVRASYEPRPERQLHFGTPAAASGSDPLRASSAFFPPAPAPAPFPPPPDSAPPAAVPVPPSVASVRVPPPSYASGPASLRAPPPSYATGSASVHAPPPSYATGPPSRAAPSSASLPSAPAVPSVSAPATPASASGGAPASPGPGAAPEWAHVNRVLAENGFGAVPASALAANGWQATPGARVVREVLVEVLGQWERRGRLLADLTQSADAARAAEKRAEKEADLVRAENGRLVDEVKKLAREADEARDSARDAARQRAEEIVAGYESQKEAAAAELKFLRREVRNLTNQLKQRDNAAAAGLAQPVRDAGPASPGGANEEEEGAAGEGAAASGGSTPFGTPLRPSRPASGVSVTRRPVVSATPNPGLGRQRPASQAEVDAELELRRVREEAAEQLHAAERKIRELERRAADAERLREEAAFELETRPTLREMHERQLLVERLQAHEAAQPPATPSRPALPALDLHPRPPGPPACPALPRPAPPALRLTRGGPQARAEAAEDELARHRQRRAELCQELDVKDVGDLVPAAARLAKSALAVPRLERFVREVCDAVDGVRPFDKPSSASDARWLDCVSASPRAAERAWRDGAGGRQLREGGPGHNAESALATLRTALASVRLVDQLTEFRSAVASELGARANMSPERAKELERAPTGTLAAIVRELVQVERVALASKDTMKHAATFLHDEPEAAVSKMVSHFMHLFDVRSLEGVFPKMNEIYLLVNQANNVLSVMRGMLGLDPKASFNACLAALRSSLDRVSAAQAFAMSAFGDAADRSGVDGKRRSLQNHSRGSGPSMATVIGASPVVDPDLDAARELRKVREALGGPGKPLRPDEVAPRVERLVKDVERSSAALSRIEPVLSYVKSALRAPTVEDIVPSMRALERSAAGPSGGYRPGRAPSVSDVTDASSEVALRRAAWAAAPAGSARRAEEAYRAERDAGLSFVSEAGPDTDSVSLGAGRAGAGGSAGDFAAAMQRSRPHAGDADEGASDLSGWLSLT
eukprot:tig00000473_g1202.t1